jgi:hypothetical protein
LTINYLGGAVIDEAGHQICELYDLTLSISHNAEMVLMSRCPKDDKTQSLLNGLPKRITDRDLDNNGEYIFEKVLRLHNPDDFKGYSQN